MNISLKPGARLFSAVCSTEMIAVKVPTGPIELTIGGVPPSGSSARPVEQPIADGHGGGTLMGKRYVNGAGTIELLCTKAGDGLPALDDEVLHVKEAKPLPASD